jgi:hypothetical protein
LPVYIVHYRREGPYHWAIFVEKDAETLTGAIFDIKGTPEDFTFKSKGKAGLKKSTIYAGRVYIGKTLGTDQNLGKVEKALKEVTIVHNDKNWNCQNWVLEGFAKLTQKKLLVDVPRHLSEEEIRKELGSQK